MPIDNIAGFPGPHTQRTTDGPPVQVNRTEPTRQQQETGRPSSVDTVSLTDTAARLRSLEDSLASLPVVDSQRVEDIQRSIAEGTFESDVNSVAQKLLRFEGDLSG